MPRLADDTWTSLRWQALIGRVRVAAMAPSRHSARRPGAMSNLPLRASEVSPRGMRRMTSFFRRLHRRPLSRRLVYLAIGLPLPCGPIRRMRYRLIVVGVALTSQQ
jgi:hypothetical protein